MANVFRTPALTTDKATGKRIPMRDKKGNVIQHPKCRGKLFLANGKNTTVTLTTDRKDSQKRLDKMQQEQDDIRNGLVPIPAKHNTALQRPIEDFFEEYHAWGETQGGRKKRPWSDGNKAMRQYYKKFWIEELDLKTVGDLNMGIAPKVEKVMQRLLQEGLSGKTVNSYREGICAPCAWAYKRGYIEKNPIVVTEKVNQKATVIRRYEPPEVWARIQDASELGLGMVLETGRLSGFRVNELRSLTPDHLRPDNKIWLSWEVDKGRTERLQPVPKELIDKLLAYAESGEAKELYRRFPVQSKDRHKFPENPLLFVPIHIARIFNRALKAAGIPKNTKEGKLDVHSTRTAYVTNVYRSGADIKTILTLTRHTTPAVGLNHYAKDSDELLRDTVATIFDSGGQNSHPTYVQQPEKMILKKTASPDFKRGCSENVMVVATGLEPVTPTM